MSFPGLRIPMIMAFFQLVGKYHNLGHPLMILLRAKIMFLSKKRKAEFVIASCPGAFLLGNFESILLMVSGVECRCKNLNGWILGAR